MTNVVKGLCRDKTVVLITNFVELVHESDRVAIVQDGEIEAFGTLQQLKHNNYLQEVLGIREQMMAEHKGAVIDVELVDSDDNEPLLSPHRARMRRVRSYASVAATSRNNLKSKVLRKLTRANTFASHQETEKERRLKRELELEQEQEEL